MIANPVDLFAEYAALNSGFCTVEPGGYFTYVTNSGSDPLTLCVSADGVTFVTQELSLNEPIISVGTSNPFVDFSGVQCGGAGAFGGSFVLFAYNLPAANGCAAQSKAFSVWLVNNQVSFSRSDEACVFELSAVNPSDGSEIVPDYLMPTGFITAQALYNAQVEARDIDGCGGGGIVLDTGSYMGTSQADYQAEQVLRGPYVQHAIETGTLTSDGVPEGGKIYQLKVAGAGMLTIDLTRNVGQSIGSYRLAVRNAIKGALDSLLGVGCHRVEVDGSGNFQVRIKMTCANGASPWAGIDKTDGYLSWCPSGGCPPTMYNTSTVVTQTQAGTFKKEIKDIYTTPCGEELKCWAETCPTTLTSPIYVLASCNYNNLTLDPATIGGNRYYIYDTFETKYRQAICHTVEVTISGTGCSTPPGPAVYSWQGGGANPKEFDPLQQDTAESDCGGCVSPGLEFCYPEARRTGHSVILNENLACAIGASSTLNQLISPDIEDCDGNDGYSMTLSSLTVHDVPAAFTSCTPNAALKVIQSVHPANILPRTYYYAYRFREGVEQRSNYNLVRVDIVPGTCCPA